MQKPGALPERPQTLGEEIANGLTHGAGLVAALAAVPLLVGARSGSVDRAQLIGGIVFGTSLVLLYLASTLYHCLPTCRAKHVMRVLDHSAIYLLIAGTYTPFMLGALRGPWGSTMLIAVWSLALFGIVAKLTIGFRFPRLSTVLYLAMGWLIVVAIGPLMESVPPAGIALLIAGGLSYTGGVVFYVLDRKVKYAHAVWHLFVLGGSACHFLAVLWHSVPPIG